MTTAVENAEEFGRHEKSGGWALGLLVASSVLPGQGEGNRSDRYGSDKISANAFGRKAGIATTTVMRYFDAWQRAADWSIVAPAGTLTPDDAHDLDHLPVDVDWSDYYTSVHGRNLTDDRREQLREIAQEAGVGASKVIDIVSNAPAVEAALADPAFATRVEKALQRHRVIDDRHDDDAHDRGKRVTAAARREAAAYGVDIVVQNLLGAAEELDDLIERGDLTEDGVQRVRDAYDALGEKLVVALATLQLA